jgi:hypothetical protein
MLDEQDTGFQVTISANQDCRNSSISLRVCRNEVLKIRGVVVLLATAQAEFTNRRHIRSKLSFPDKNFGGSFAAFVQWAGSSYLEHLIIS